MLAKSGAEEFHVVERAKPELKETAQQTDRKKTVHTAS